MGYFSELAIELEEEYNIDLDDYEFDIEQYLKDSDGNQMDFTISQMSDYLDFKKTVEKEIENDHSDIPDDFRYFFYRLLPDIPPRKVMRYHMYVSTPQGDSVNLTFTDRYDYVQALYTMSKNDNYNVFFSLIPYRKKRKTKANATYAQGFFIDIDGLDFDVLSMTKEEVIDFLMTEYGVPSHLLPQMICKSGHGLHLFMWLWEPIKDENIRRKIAESLVTYYKADFCSSRITQNIRVPGSFNVKGSPLKTEYYMINDHGGFFIDEFKHFMKSKEEIEDYKISENKKRAAKSAATRAKNEAERIARGEPPKQRKKKNQQPTEQKEEKIERPKPVDISSLEYFRYFSPHARRHNLLGDLHNYFIRHGGDIYGHRASFITIVANYAWYFMNLDECIDYCSKYVDDDFYPEMEKIVRFVYSKPLKERYTYRYTTIADLLGFTDEDIRLSYCCSFSEERREDAKKRAKKKENEKKKAETRKRKETTINYVVENINLPVKELALNCNVSERTIYRIKESIRQQSSA